MITFLAVHPGTHRTGVALFKGHRLENWWVCEVPRELEIQDRIRALVSQMETIVLANPEVRQVVCEQDGAMAPELKAFIRRLRGWARSNTTIRRRRGHNFAWETYNLRNVTATVRQRGMTWKPGSKESLTIGVLRLYGNGLGAQSRTMDQTVVEAIAVGHCHLANTQPMEYAEEALHGL